MTTNAVTEALAARTTEDEFEGVLTRVVAEAARTLARHLNRTGDVAASFEALTAEMLEFDPTGVQVRLVNENGEMLLAMLEAMGR